MARSADNRNTPPVRQPGDFARHPTTGAPYVNHPTDLTKKGEPRRVMYGRPSSLGKQIENTTNLQKWAERAVALGAHLAPELAADLHRLDPDQLTLDDADTKQLLDRIAVAAKRAAQTHLAADRGTHTHALTEDADLKGDWLARLEAGQDLGLPHDTQQALVDVWAACIEANGLEILEVERTVVDDRWRQAGTLDRIARLGRDLRFVMPTGEAVTLAAGTVVILDIKTGRIRERNGVVSYWQSYAVQIASYAQAVPYDVDTDTRGEWGFDIDQTWALIAHLDVRAALDGEASCRLVLVDLDAGRCAGDLCVEARAWERADGVFSRVDVDDHLVKIVSAPDGPPPSVERGDAPDTRLPPAGGSSGATSPTGSSEYGAGGNAPGEAPPLSSSGASSPTIPSSGGSADDTDTVPVSAASVSRPQHYDHAEPPLDDDIIDGLVATIAASPVREQVNAWVVDGRDGGKPWNPRRSRVARCFEIARAAFHLALTTDGWDDGDADEARRHFIGTAMNTDPAQDSIPVGVALGDLTEQEARLLTRICQRVLDADGRIDIDTDGRWVAPRGDAA